MESEGEIFTPDRFIPLIAQFNLSHRFDMCVMEKLLLWLRDHPARRLAPVSPSI
jgi:EAL domain-containing protein (putative c-di-GMP-specific phosphodiesterase class I)